MSSPSKVEPRHTRLRAVIYIRQSTPQQVLNNREGTRRQYQLVERAQQMGWPDANIRVIDDDLGLSGAGSQQRLGFQRLVAAIGLGEVGIVLVTEISRLSRLNSDWHRVIELCAVFRTLIADEDGVYDAQNANDRLLLGMKGTLFAAELHILQARMHGALLSKARRGELVVCLPVGSGAGRMASPSSIPTRPSAWLSPPCSSASRCCATHGRCSGISCRRLIPLNPTRYTVPG
jgi:DNA invertase Pin-like site-specific DNA recombinase